jgi:hypothetical protein
LFAIQDDISILTMCFHYRWGTHHIYRKLPHWRCSKSIVHQHLKTLARIFRQLCRIYQSFQVAFWGFRLPGDHSVSSQCITTNWSLHSLCGPFLQNCYCTWSHRVFTLLSLLLWP